MVNIYSTKILFFKMISKLNLIKKKCKKKKKILVHDKNFKPQKEQKETAKNGVQKLK
jgi:hypothetical protein